MRVEAEVIPGAPQSYRAAVPGAGAAHSSPWCELRPCASARGCHGEAPRCFCPYLWLGWLPPPHGMPAGEGFSHHENTSPLGAGLGPPACSTLAPKLPPNGNDFSKVSIK